MTSVSSTPGHCASSSSLRCEVPATSALEIIKTRMLSFPASLVGFLVDGQRFRGGFAPVEARRLLQRTGAQIGCKRGVGQHAAHGGYQLPGVVGVEGQRGIPDYFRQRGAV